MKKLLLALCILASACSEKTIQCPAKTGCSYQAIDESGNVSTIYQIHYDGNSYNIGEEVHANECKDIYPKSDSLKMSLKMYVIISERKPLKDDY